MITIGLATDGGRWLSVYDGQREWLWHHPDPAVRAARAVAQPGSAFVDAGGVEECFPTVRGHPDHGAAWTARWNTTDAHDRSGTTRTDECRMGDTRLRRTINQGEPITMIDYQVIGVPGHRFVHAVHALLELSDTARVSIEGNPAMRVLDHDQVQHGNWPDLDGTDVSFLTPVDHSAYAMIIDCSEVLVTDRGHQLRWAWQVTEGSAPTALMFWRNLRGWPQPGPYRTIGIEPLIGRTADPAAEPDAAAQLDRSGRLRWRLELSTPG